MYLHQKISTCSYFIAKHFCFLLLRWDTGKVRDRFGGMLKGGFRCKGWVNSVTINVITEINYRCNYMQVFFLNISTM